MITKWWCRSDSSWTDTTLHQSCFCNFQDYWNNMFSWHNFQTCMICVLHDTFLISITCAPVCDMLHLTAFCLWMQHFHHTLPIGVYCFKWSVPLGGRLLLAGASAHGTILYRSALHCAALQNLLTCTLHFIYFTSVYCSALLCAALQCVVLHTALCALLCSVLYPY